MLRIYIILFFVLSFLISSCSPSESSIQTAIGQTHQSNTQQAEIVIDTATPTENQREQTMIANQTQYSATLVAQELLATNKALTPSPTKKPTNTPRPTSTRTPIPEPIFIEGTGDSVIDINKTFSLGIMHIINTSSRGNFSVWNYDANNEMIDLLVNTIGEYDGHMPFDWVDDENTARLEINSPGSWSIEIFPFDLPYILDFITDVPNTINGAGDSILIFPDGADLAIIDASTAKSNFVVYAYGESGLDLLVNEIAPYTGTVMIPSGATGLEIEAEGEWSIELTER